MPTLYLLCGLPFSGKSTIARRLAAERGVALVSLDSINEERGIYGEDGLPVEEWERTHEVALGRVLALMSARADIVVDDTNCYRWIRDRWREFAGGRLYDSLVLYVPVDIEVLRRRVETCTSRREIAPEVFDECVRTFEPPSDEETVVLGDPDAIDAFLESRPS